VLPPVSIVWPCSLSVDEYVAVGRDLEVPRPVCPKCSAAMTLWSGYQRYVRKGGLCVALWVPRVRCGACRKTHALLPAFVAANRLDVVESIGALIDEVGTSPGGVRPVAARLGVPHCTARGWMRRFGNRAREHAVAFAALAVELGGEVVTLQPGRFRWCLAAIDAAWWAATGLPGWLGVGRWRFVCCVTSGSFIATNTNSPFLIVGKRRFMPPVP
jgi:transposase-like protein